MADADAIALDDHDLATLGNAYAPDSHDANAVERQRRCQ
jgi:hypothetical protein